MIKLELVGVDTCVNNGNDLDAKWDKFGVTWKGLDCESRAVEDRNGDIWVADEDKWILCHPGIRSVFTPYDSTKTTKP